MLVGSVDEKDECRFEGIDSSIARRFESVETIILA
jgi:hypothetical protein